MTSKKCIWKKHIAAWENSDISQAEYCRKHGLSYKSFAYNKRKTVDSGEQQKIIPVLDIPMRTGGEVRTCKPIVLRVSGGLRIEIEPDFCQFTLKRLLEVVGF